MANDDMNSLQVLRSIDNTLKHLVSLFMTEKNITAAPKVNIATDSDLDSQYGDELVRAKMPKDWTGADFKGARMSECPPELLDMLADRHVYFAGRNEDDGDKKKAGYERRSEARARGWARRLRAGWKPPVREETAGEGDIKW